MEVEVEVEGEEVEAEVEVEVEGEEVEVEEERYPGRKVGRQIIRTVIHQRERDPAPAEEDHHQDHH